MGKATRIHLTTSGLLPETDSPIMMMMIDNDDVPLGERTHGRTRAYKPIYSVLPVLRPPFWIYYFRLLPTTSMAV